MDVERHYTVAQAAAELGPLTVSTLRNAIARGELIPVRIGARIFLTEAIVREWLASCRDRAKARACGSASEPAATPSGSSSTADASTAQAAASATVLLLKGRSRNTSRANTGRKPALAPSTNS